MYIHWEQLLNLVCSPLMKAWSSPGFTISLIKISWEILLNGLLKSRYTMSNIFLCFLKKSDWVWHDLFLIKAAFSSLPRIAFFSKWSLTGGLIIYSRFLPGIDVKLTGLKLYGTSFPPLFKDRPSIALLWSSGPVLIFSFLKDHQRGFLDNIYNFSSEVISLSLEPLTLSGLPCLP